MSLFPLNDSQKRTAPKSRPVLYPGYQPLVTTALRLLEVTGLNYDAPILHLGAGDPLFVPALLARGYANIVAVDHDATALDRFRSSLPLEQTDRVLWVVDDVLNPRDLAELNPVLLWHDRTQVHALATPAQRVTYGRLLNHMISAYGWVLLGLSGPEGNGLTPEARLAKAATDADRLVNLLGGDYALRHVFEEPHLPLPAAPDHAAYALFQRNGTCRGGWWANP